MLACGPNVVESTNDDDGSTSVTPSSSSGDDGSSTRDESSNESGVPISCDQYLDEGRESRPVTVAIVNGGGEPIMLDAPCFNYDYLTMATESGWYWPLGFCGATCQSQFSEGCFVCDGCASAAYTVVMPGGSVEIEWPGVLYEDLAPPQQCYQYEACGEECPRARVEIPEIVRATVRAISYDACVGAQTDPTVCTCVDTKALTCETGANESVAPDLEQNGIYEPGSTSPITVTFGP